MSREECECDIIKYITYALKIVLSQLLNYRLFTSSYITTIIFTAITVQYLSQDIYEPIEAVCLLCFFKHIPIVNEEF